MYGKLEILDLISY